MYDAIMIAAALATIAGFFVALQASPTSKGRLGRVKVRGHSTLKKFRDRIVFKYPELVFLAPLSFLAGSISKGAWLLVVVICVILYRFINNKFKWFPAIVTVLVCGSIGWNISYFQIPEAISAIK